MSAASSQAHEGGDRCDFCNEPLTKQNRNQYCVGKGWYSTGTAPYCLKSVSAWKALGYKVRKDQLPAARVYGHGLPSSRQWYGVYGCEQCDKITRKDDK